MLSKFHGTWDILYAVSLSFHGLRAFFGGGRSDMDKEKTVSISAVNNRALLPVQKNECPGLMKKIGKTTYRVTIHFSTTSRETLSDKIKRMLRNEISGV
jgi:hypothetical protein